MDDRVGDCGTVQRDVIGGEQRNQGNPQVGRAERLRDMPVHQVGQRAVSRRVFVGNHHPRRLPAGHLPRPPFPPLADGQGTCKRQAYRLHVIRT